VAITPTQYGRTGQHWVVGYSRLYIDLHQANRVLMESRKSLDRKRGLSDGVCLRIKITYAVPSLIIAVLYLTLKQ
jgi:hypothetical protein